MACHGALAATVGVAALKSNWGCSSVGLERLPVTQKVASSSLVSPADVHQ